MRAKLLRRWNNSESTLWFADLKKCKIKSLYDFKKFTYMNLQLLTFALFLDIKNKSDVDHWCTFCYFLLHDQFTSFVESVSFKMLFSCCLNLHTHCLVQKITSLKRLSVLPGEHDVMKDEGPEEDLVVAEQHIHPMYDYKKSPYNHDIALLRLARPVELSNQRRPICLGPKDFTENILRESSGSLVSGWGRRKFQGPEATRLQKVEVPYVDRTQCKQSSRYHITRFMFCAGFDTTQKDSCQGDSGGPHATKYKGTWFLTGIVSWGEECAKDGKYGIYTRVSRYYPWISQKTGIRFNNWRK